MMIDKTIDTTDDFLSRVNDFLRSATDRITPNIVLLVAIFNGSLIGLVTTGYLGANSMPVQSISFFLIIWQFAIVCFFSSRYVDLTIGYLNKFALCGFFGFFWQWEIFGKITSDPKLITPPAEHPVVIMFLGYATIFFLLGYCFKNNKKNTAKVYELPKERHVA